MGHPSLDLNSKTAVVIGGTSGIGLALAKGLARAGANVIPTGRRTELVESAADEIRQIGRKTIAVTTDVTNKSSLEALLQRIESEWGAVDILVNSAGTTKKAPTVDFPEHDWNQIIEVNLNGTLRACQVFGKKMSASMDELSISHPCLPL
jgi:NAD(P)-dependent dehydrogenase (short-subunit alcohol dehydrogenase family)